MSNASAPGEDDSLASVLQSLKHVNRREDAVAALIALPQVCDTRAGHALLRGFSQSVRLHKDNKPMKRPYWQQQYAEGSTNPDQLDFEVLVEAAQSPLASPLVRAHIGHLVFSYRSNQIEIAAAAVDAYLDLAKCPRLKRIEHYALASKAFDLARRLNDDARMVAIRAQLLTVVDEAIAASSSGLTEGGTVLRALEYFVFCDGAKSEAEARLRQALPIYAEDWHLRRELALLFASLQENKTESDAILSEHLRAIIVQASMREAFLREGLLREVLTTARTQGLRHVAGEASSALAQIRPDDYDFSVSEFTLELEDEARSQVEQFREHLRTSPPHEAWARWASKTPTFLPANKRPPYEFRVADRIATLAMINRAGHVSFEASCDNDIVRFRHHEEDLALYNYQFQLLVGPGLHIILSRPDCVAALIERLEDSLLFTSIGADRVRRAFTAFQEGEMEPVGNALPTIEAAIRALALQAQISIYNPSGGANVFKTLGGLIADLIPNMENAACLGRFWEFALTDQLGFNIRNDYLHGFLEQLSHRDAVVVLQVLGQILFVLDFKPTQTSEETIPNA